MELQQSTPSNGRKDNIFKDISLETIHSEKKKEQKRVKKACEIYGMLQKESRERGRKLI